MVEMVRRLSRSVVAPLRRRRHGGKQSRAPSNRARASSGADDDRAKANAARSSPGRRCYPANGATNVVLDSPIVVPLRTAGASLSPCARPAPADLPCGRTPDGTRWLAYQALAPGATSGVTVRVPTEATCATTSTSLPDAPPPGRSCRRLAVPAEGRHAARHWSAGMVACACERHEHTHRAVLRRARGDRVAPRRRRLALVKPTELHFRPRSYWPAGERSRTVTSDLDGWDRGDGPMGRLRRAPGALHGRRRARGSSKPRDAPGHDGQREHGTTYPIHTPVPDDRTAHTWFSTRALCA